MEHHLAKVGAAGSIPVSRSKEDLSGLDRSSLCEAMSHDMSQGKPCDWKQREPGGLEYVGMAQIYTKENTMEETENSWVSRALADDDPNCIRTPEELTLFVEKVGFLPLFSNNIPGFSVEEYTAASAWFSGDPSRDPWTWREILASGKRVVYGKFFFGNAGFVAKDFFADFANVRRDGYDFDALWDDEKASRKQKKIMDLFADEAAELFSFEIKQKAGFGRDGETGFDSVLTGLQMLTYLCPMDFQQRKNKAGKEYGWNIAIFCKPEHLLGAEAVTGSYKDEPEVSLARMLAHLMAAFPGMSEEQGRKVLVGERPKDESKKKKVPYPENLLSSLDLNAAELPVKAWASIFSGHRMEYAEPTDDQLKGLEHALAQLYKKSQKVISLRYQEYMTFKSIGPAIGKSSATAGTIHKKALGKLRHPSLSCWILDGYEGHLRQIARHTETVLSALHERKPEFDLTVFSHPLGMYLKKGMAGKLEAAGLRTVGDLDGLLLLPEWNRLLPGIGAQSARRLMDELSGIITGMR